MLLPLLLLACVLTVFLGEWLLKTHKDSDETVPLSARPLESGTAPPALIARGAPH